MLTHAHSQNTLLSPAQRYKRDSRETMCVVLKKWLFCMWEFQKHRTVIVTHVSPSSSCLVALVWSIPMSSILAFSNLVVSIGEPKDCVAWLGARRDQDEAILGSSTVIWHPCWKAYRMRWKPTTYRYDLVSEPTNVTCQQKGFHLRSFDSPYFQIQWAAAVCHIQMSFGRCRQRGSWVLGGSGSKWVLTLVQ